MVRFAAIGLDHRHIYHHVEELLAAGAQCAGYCPETTDPVVLDGFRKRFPQLQATDRRRLLEDRSIDLICCAAVPRDRAGIAIAAMHNGKDVMVDKPGVTTSTDLDAVRRTVAETGRIFSICFTERLIVPSMELAGRLVAEGAIGRMVQSLGIGPHRLNRAIRPAWFFDRHAFGGILADIASHQIDQFLFLTGSNDAEIVASSVANYTVLDHPDFEDFGEILLRSDRATGYVRVDWFTPDGLPTWGDGRLMLLGTEGYIEVRKYIDIAGRDGGDHVLLCNAKGVTHLDGASEKLTYFRKFLDDIRHRTATAMPQEHVFTVTRLALEAQAKATRLMTAQPG